MNEQTGKRYDEIKLVASESESEREFIKVFTTSLIVIVLCMISLGGLTWAWYEASTVYKDVMISAANYRVSIAYVQEIDPDSMDPIGDKLPLNDNGCFLLQGRKTYRVKLDADGTASNGYAAIYLGSSVYSTEPITLEIAGDVPEFITDITQIVRSGVFVFTITVNRDDPVEMSVLGVWGVSSDTNIYHDIPFIFPVAQPEGDSEPVEP